MKGKVGVGKVVVSGTLSQAPKRRRLKNGTLCATAVVKSTCAEDGNRTRIWQIAAFNDAVQSALMRLSPGDPIIVQGTFKAEMQGQNGEIALLFGLSPSVSLLSRRNLQTESWPPLTHC
jgi:single-stranded DNA-binding protein